MDPKIATYKFAVIPQNNISSKLEISSKFGRENSSLDEKTIFTANLDVAFFQAIRSPLVLTLISNQFGKVK